MALYSFPRMDGQPSRMTTEQMCEEAYNRGYLEGKAAGEEEREAQLKSQLNTQLENSQALLKEEVTKELNETYKARYQNEFENVISQIKQNEKERDTQLGEALTSVIETVCKHVLEQELSVKASQSIASIESLLSNLPFAENVCEIQMGQVVYNAWDDIEVKQVKDIALCSNDSLAPMQIRLVSQSHYHEINYEDRLNDVINQITTAMHSHDQ